MDMDNTNSQHFQGPYTIAYINQWPQELKIGEVFISTEVGDEYCTFHCPCGGCGLLLVNMNPNKKTSGQAAGCWIVGSYSDHGFFIPMAIGNKMSLSPSIQRNSGCRNHFWIDKGYVEWC